MSTVVQDIIFRLSNPISTPTKYYRGATFFFIYTVTNLYQICVLYFFVTLKY